MSVEEEKEEPIVRSIYSIGYHVTLNVAER